MNPVWSPDGRYIVFDGNGGLFWTRSDGAGKPQPLLAQSNNTQMPFSFTPDGKRLAFDEGLGRHVLWSVPLESNTAGLRAGKAEVLLQSPFDQRHPMFSPDGRWLAYSSNESGAFQVYVRAFPDKGGKRQVSNNGGAYPVWSRKGGELFFRNPDDQIMVATYTAKNESFAADKPRLWSAKHLVNSPIVGMANYDLGPGGKRVVALIPIEAPEAREQNHVIFLENFSDELQRKVPTGK